MERGETEKNCFDYLKSIVLSNNNICYVCSDEDDKLIKQIFQTAIPNPESSKFPDFIFDFGLVEHFEVTSSHSNRKGSKMKIEQYSLQKEAEDKEKKFIAEMNENSCYEERFIITDKWHSAHSYDNFCLSFKRAWQHHIESLSKYDGNKTIGIFMIQYNDSALFMDAVFPNVKSGVYYGDLLEKPKYRGYRLTHDSVMLEYIYQFKEKIKYVAFFNNDGINGKRCEIICVENVPEILKIVKGKYRFHCAMIGTAHTVYGISTPDSLHKGNNEDE